ncbi:hypothetical protein NML71_04625 [Streptococcus sp. CF4-2]|uniref:hypothetical protein n=1 Tax=unclassified Streptococcus TaxID=2608887 RepID=UPI0020CA1ABA|nr:MULTISPECIES: hypothetical protein [unclassified Streptococcus]MCP9075645.1 hypothetical protein [Streptococcus sp. CF4-3]MCP9088458.1 hypothetical protein [Streptococcus sp. CF4-2]
MEENQIFQLAVKTSEKIKNVFGERITEPKIVDVVEYLPYQRFGIRFVAYDYYLIFFNYDRGFCSFSIFVGERYGASLNGGKSMVGFGEIKDWDSYLKEIMAEIELHIPDKFLKAKGWYKRRGILQCLKVKWIF